jgi:hypothetical protein
MKSSVKYRVENPDAATPPEATIGIEILGRHWEVVWAPQFLTEDRYGHCDPDNQIILMRSGMRGAQCLDTFIHEITHAISDSTNIDLTEHQVHNLGMAWNAIFRSNPELLMFIMERIKEEEARDYQQRTRTKRGDK